MIAELFEKLVLKYGEGAALAMVENLTSDSVHALDVLHTPANAIQEAWRLTHGERRSDYGTPTQVFSGYALMWTALLAKKLKPGEVVSASDVTLMMTALKLAREANAPKGDNVVDAHGYLIMHEEVSAR